MERSKDPGSRTRRAAGLAAGWPRLTAALAGVRRPRLVAAACALVLAAPLAVVAATGTVAQARPDGDAARSAGGAVADGDAGGWRRRGGAHGELGAGRDG